MCRYGYGMVGGRLKMGDGLRNKRRGVLRETDIPFCLFVEMEYSENSTQYTILDVCV